MSIYFDYEVGSTGRRFRRAVDSDKNDIKHFWRKGDTEPLFGEVDIGSLIELSALSICLINANKEVIGFMSLSDHPPVPGLDPAHWEYWVRNMYQKYYLSRNTMFVHFMCCIDSVSDFFIEEAVISVFLNDPYLLYIIIVVPSTCPEELLLRYQTLKKRHIIMSLSKVDKESPTCHLLTATRNDFCPKLRIRRAVQEDNDDVVEILEKKTNLLTEMYGQYYISEIVAGLNIQSNRDIIVAEVQGRAVAVMCINTDINYLKLQNTYNLKPYYGLKVATSLEKEKNRRTNKLLTMFGNPIMNGTFGQFDAPNKPNQTLSDKSKKAKQPKSEKASKVIFKSSLAHYSEDSISFIPNIDSHESGKEELSPASSLFSLPSLTSVAYLLDEDSFDYDIVNIDESLLNIESSNMWFTMPKSELTLNNQKHIQGHRKDRLKRLRRLSKNIRLLKEKPSTIYSGHNNAFMIELFAFRNDIDERHSYDLLEAAFELTKDYEYCIIRVPSENKGFNLLQHFTLVPTRPQVVSKYSLYVAHRSSVLGKMRVRQAELVDIPGIARFLQTAEAKETVCNIENMILNKQKNKAFVFTSGMSVVGMGIVGPLDQSTYLRVKFNIDSYEMHKYHYEGQGSDAGYGAIKCVIAYPAFEPHYRFFLREMMRLSGCTKLMWTSAYRNKWAVNKANSLVTGMIPLTPLRFEIDSKTFPEFKDYNHFSEPVMAFSAWYIGKKYTTIPKVNVTTSIVIVGASRTAFGFLNELLFSKTSTYLTFTNITLISTTGLPYCKHSKPIEESMFFEHRAMREKYLKSVPYTYYVSVVQGTLMDINLSDKYVRLTSGARHHYDLLFLFIGIQYQLPNHMDHLLEREKAYQEGLVPEYIRFDDPRHNEATTQDLGIVEEDAPVNMFIINSLNEATSALKYVDRLFRLYHYKIIVYGATIHTFLCIKILLKKNVPPGNIIFVEPFPSENPKKIRSSVFFNENVDETVNKVLAHLGIEIYRSYHLQSWTVNANHSITHVTFLSYYQSLKLECSALFYYGKRGLNMKSYVAIHRSGLAYDGGIVIDHECKTRDPNVYAAGPCTRYHRKYYAEEYRHKYYDSFEIGKKLAIIIRNQLDPLFIPKLAPGCDPENRKEQLVKLLELKKPKTICCVLPGGFHYLDVRAPGKKMPHHYVQSLGFNGFVMQTFKHGYFKLHFTREFVVDGVTCLTKSVSSLEKFKYLYGHSAIELNNVHWRFTANKLDNFFEFFQSPWAFFLYHDHVDELFAVAKQLYPKGEIKGLTLHEALHNAEIVFSNPPQIKFDACPYIDAVTDYVMEWLVEHDTLLPVYLYPLKLSVFERHRIPPFFRKKKYRIVDMLIN